MDYVLTVNHNGSVQPVSESNVKNSAVFRKINAFTTEHRITHLFYARCPRQVEKFLNCISVKKVFRIIYNEFPFGKFQLLANNNELGWEYFENLYFSKRCGSMSKRDFSEACIGLKKFM